MTDKLDWLEAEAQQLRDQGLWRDLTDRPASVPARADGEASEDRINFGSNDYLGLATDPRLVDAALRAAQRWGWGAGSSPMVYGWSPEHQGLADELAEFEQVEAAVLFPTGFAANLGTIAALMGRDDAVYLDRLNHACLIDGVRLARSTLRPYRHADPEHLEHLLVRDRGRFTRRLIATDGVFSMDGDLAPLDRLVELADRYGAMMLVDEAHATGVFGPDGRGASSHFGVADRVEIRVGTCSKALGGLGGFVAGSRRLIAWLTNRARPWIYSTAQPPAVVAATREALRIAQNEPWRSRAVLDLADWLGEELRDRGWDVPDVPGPILPVLIGDPEQAVQLSEDLRASGLLVPAIRTPTVPRGTDRLRISLSANHTRSDLMRLTDMMDQLWNRQVLQGPPRRQADQDVAQPLEGTSQVNQADADRQDRQQDDQNRRQRDQQGGLEQPDQEPLQPFR